MVNEITLKMEEENRDYAKMLYSILANMPVTPVTKPLTAKIPSQAVPTKF